MDIGAPLKTIFIPLPDDKPAVQPQKIEPEEQPIEAPNWPLKSPIPVKEPANT